MSTDRTVTRRIRSSLGGSMPVASAAAVRSSFRDHSSSLTSCMVTRSKTAGCRKGRTSANASSPSEALAAAIARSWPTARAVVTRTWARSVMSAGWVAAMVALPKSVSAGDPSGRTRSRMPSICPCANPNPWSRSAMSQVARSSPSSTSAGSIESNELAVASLTSSASPSAAVPAATTGITCTPPRSAIRVRNASCSTNCSRLAPRCGDSPRCQSADQVDASS